LGHSNHQRLKKSEALKLRRKHNPGWWLKKHLEKYEFVNGKDDIPYIMENKKCLKPPTSIYSILETSGSTAIFFG